MTSFKIRISHTTHASLASNINLVSNLYLEHPNINFVMDYADVYGGIKEEGIMHIVSCDITTIITGAQLVMIMNGIIYEVTKTRFLEECMPKTDIIQNAYKNKTKQILTKKGVMNVNIPTTPPPNQRIIHKRHRRAQIECRQGQSCWRHKHKTTIETEV
jgi:hypothetical protein